MIRERFVRSVPGRWITAIMGWSLIVAPFGCETAVVLDAADASPDKVGFAFNKDVDSNLIMSLSGEDGRTVFVFGKRSAAGISSISAITVRDADGTESFITFESGRPAHVQGADGSYAHIMYENVGFDGLQAVVDLYSAAEDTVERYSVDIDLQESLETWAQRFQDETGIELAVVETTSEDAAKDATAARTAGVLIVPMFVVPFTALVSTTSLILSQVFVFVLRVAVAAVTSILTAIMYPFIVLAEITETALVLPSAIVDMLAFHGVVPAVPVYVLH